MHQDCNTLIAITYNLLKVWENGEIGFLFYFSLVEKLKDFLTQSLNLEIVIIVQ